MRACRTLPAAAARCKGVLPNLSAVPARAPCSSSSGINVVLPLLACRGAINIEYRLNCLGLVSMSRRSAFDDSDQVKDVRETYCIVHRRLAAGRGGIDVRIDADEPLHHKVVTAADG